MNDVMQGFFPPAPTAQVTLGNWREAPFSRWAFHHVREIVPSARIAADPDRRRALPHNEDPQLLALDVSDASGSACTVEDLLQRSDSDGFVVLHRGAVVAEWDRGEALREPHIVFSVSKSLTAVLAGVLVDAGKLDPQAPVSDYVPEAEGSVYGGDCRVRHVLDMTVGIDFDEAYLDASGAFRRYRIATGWNPPEENAEPGDLRSFLVTLEPDGTPHGHQFHYVSPNSDLLGWILERASGERFSDLFSRLVWQPLGAEQDGYVTVDRLGAPRTAGGICVTVRDLARFGEMMRLGGASEGRQVIPQGWVEDIRTRGDRAAWGRGEFHRLFPHGCYRSKWYQTGDDHGAFCAIGIHGQWLYVDPTAETVIAKLAAQAQPIDDATDHAWLAAFAKIARHCDG